MNEPGKNPFEMLLDQFRSIVREELAVALGDTKKAAVIKEWLSAKECSALYGLPPTWFEEKGRTGQIARTKPGRYVLFKRRDVEEYLERNKKSS
jgi:excisionase family DNA binding protein